MTEFNDPRRPGYRNFAGRSSSTWIGGAIIVILILIGIGYAMNGGYGVNNNAVERRAADVQGSPAPSTPPSASPAAPAPAPSNNAKP